MQRSTYIILLLLITLAAIVLAWFWALPPFLSWVNWLQGWTGAQIVRANWHFRLVQPEWVSVPSENAISDYIDWAEMETMVRVIVVFLCWASSSVFIERRYLKSRKEPLPALVVS